MASQVISYFASRMALKLWAFFTLVFVLGLFLKLHYEHAQLTVVQGILFTTDLLHFWLPIIACRYLSRIRSESV